MEQRQPQDPPRVVVAAYALAALSLLVPLAAVGGLFAGIALARRNRPLEGLGVIAVTLVATALGIALLR